MGGQDKPTRKTGPVRQPVYGRKSGWTLSRKVAAPPYVLPCDTLVLTIVTYLGDKFIIKLSYVRVSRTGCWYHENQVPPQSWHSTVHASVQNLKSFNRDEKIFNWRQCEKLTALVSVCFGYVSRPPGLLNPLSLRLIFAHTNTGKEYERCNLSLLVL